MTSTYIVQRVPFNVRVLYDTFVDGKLSGLVDSYDTNLFRSASLELGQACDPLPLM